MANVQLVWTHYAIKTLPDLQERQIQVLPQTGFMADANLWR
jgi:hypothetical protein